MTCTRVVYITLEYCKSDLFSGNGVCARSQVRNLAANAVRVHVICGRPKGEQYKEAALDNVKVSVVELDTWFSTERSCSHEAFAEGAAAVLRRLDWSTYDACLVVDWTGSNALIKGPSTLPSPELIKPHIPIIFLSFRVYMRMADISEDDRAFYTRNEKLAVRLSLSSKGGIVSLCHLDNQMLQSFGRDETHYDPRRFHKLLPMLRAEIASVARENRDRILNFGRRRIYLTSLVRLSEDKGAGRFVRLLQNIQQDDPDFWNLSGIVPLMLGVGTQPAYAQRVRDELQRTVKGAVIMDTFLTPEQLASVLQDAILNVHPGLYEAYGMTIVEAAAMGCPSVVHVEDIGATQLLVPEHDAVFVEDLCDEKAFAKRVRSVLLDDALRTRVAHKAFHCAMSWTEEEHGASLLRFCNGIVKSIQTGEMNGSQ